MIELGEKETSELVDKLKERIEFIENPRALDKNYNHNYNALDRSLYDNSRIKYEQGHETNFNIQLDIYHQMPSSVLGMTDKWDLNITLNDEAIRQECANYNKVNIHEIRHCTIGPGYAMHDPDGEEGWVRDGTSTRYKAS